VAARAKRVVEPVVAEPEDDGRPAWWDFNSEQDGPTVEGAFVRVGKGGTRIGGTSPFIVLEVEGQGERTVWCHHAVLVNEIKREIEERGPIKEGERLRITQGNAKSSERNPGQTYLPFRVEFLDRAYSQEDIFGAEPKKSDSIPSPADPTDDDIPFGAA
jgi:hypothetical protein